MNWDFVCDVVRVVNVFLVMAVLFLMNRNAKRDRERWDKTGEDAYWFFFGTMTIVMLGFIEKLSANAGFAFTPFVMSAWLVFGIRTLYKSKGITLR